MDRRNTSREWIAFFRHIEEVKLFQSMCFRWKLAMNVLLQFLWFTVAKRCHFGEKNSCLQLPRMRRHACEIDRTNCTDLIVELNHRFRRTRILFFVKSKPFWNIKSTFLLFSLIKLSWSSCYEICNFYIRNSKKQFLLKLTILSLAISIMCYFAKQN